jgi:phosphatidylglycerol lysyltransferase
MNRRLLQSIGPVVSVCLFVLAILLLHHELRGYRYRDIVYEVRQVGNRDLLSAVVLTILNYLILTANDALALRYARHPLPYRQLAFASFIGYAFSNSATVVGGTAARYRIYTALGLSASEIAEVVVYCGITVWLGFFLVAGTAFVLEPQYVHLPQRLHLPVQSVGILGIGCLAAVGVYMLAVVLRRRPITIRGWQLRVPSPALSVGQIVVTSTDWLLAAGVMYVLLPDPMQATYLKFIGIFMLGQGLGMISHVPGGLGVFETVLLFSISNRAEAPALTAALLLYRLIYYILPLLLGSLLLAIHEVLLRMTLVRRVGIHVGKWGSAVAPQVFAFAVFVAGSILLFSGALPTVRGRAEILRGLLPLPAIELSHFLGSLTGAMLLILARGLQRRLDGAYHITILMLVAGIGFSLLKGLGYEEAIILGIMLAALLPCRSEFYRKASLTAQRFSPGWTVLIIIVLLCSVWLGLFAYKHVEYSHDLWWKFTFRGDAPRFLRGTAGAVALILLYAVARLLVPARPQPATLNADTLAKVHEIVRASPRTHASLALLGDKQFILSDSEDAFLMYGVENRSWVALGDPIGPQEQWEDLTWKFIELSDRYHGRPAFYQIDAQTLDLYTNLGMTFLKLGEEARVPLTRGEGVPPLNRGQDARDTQGRDGLATKKGLRHSHNKFATSNYTFRIVPAEQVPDILDRLKRVSDAWLQEKNTREKGFSLGFFDPAYISQCPVAVVDNAEGIAAFANLWQGAGKQELSIDLMRYLPSCPEDIMDYLLVELMQWGRQEGYQWFNLGMAPLSGLENRALAPLWSKTGNLIFRLGEHFYNFQGLRQYKEKFDPEWHPKYLACRGGLALPRVLTNIASLISGSLGGMIKK